MRDQLGARTCDLVEDDPEKGIRKFAKPFGVVANVVPCTNPESDGVLHRARIAEDAQRHDRLAAPANPGQLQPGGRAHPKGARQGWAHRRIWRCASGSRATTRPASSWSAATSRWPRVVRPSSRSSTRRQPPCHTVGGRQRGVDHRRDGGPAGHGREDRQIQVRQQLRVVLLGERGGGGRERLRSDGRGARGRSAAISARRKSGRSSVASTGPTAST